MKLNKTDTYTILYEHQKFIANYNRYKYTTRFPIACLGCLKRIYVNYETLSIPSIFCPECKWKVNFEHIGMHHYLRKIKEKQMNLINDLITI